MPIQPNIVRRHLIKNWNIQSDYAKSSAQELDALYADGWKLETQTIQDGILSVLMHRDEADFSGTSNNSHYKIAWHVDWQGLSDSGIYYPLYAPNESGAKFLTRYYIAERLAISQYDVIIDSIEAL